jgi:hypothetical protein
VAWYTYDFASASTTHTGATVRPQFNTTASANTFTIANITWQVPVVAPSGDLGDYKPAPKDWYGRMLRRRRGQKLLLSMMDVYDRLEWYEHRVVRLQYPLRSECGSDYGGRTLFLTPKGNFEFYKSVIKSRRNIWICTSGRADQWSLEDRYLGLIFSFQTDFQHFVQVGCRDCLYKGEEQDVEDWYAYGYEMRQRAIAREKKDYSHLCNPTIDRRRIDAIK